jgi:hypothetical protein
MRAHILPATHDCSGARSNVRVYPTSSPRSRSVVPVSRGFAPSKASRSSLPGVARGVPTSLRGVGRDPGVAAASSPVAGGSSPGSRRTTSGDQVLPAFDRRCRGRTGDFASGRVQFPRAPGGVDRGDAFASWFDAALRRSPLGGRRESQVLLRWNRFARPVTRRIFRAHRLRTWDDAGACRCARLAPCCAPCALPWKGDDSCVERVRRTRHPENSRVSTQHLDAATGEFSGGTRERAGVGHPESALRAPRPSTERRNAQVRLPG